MTATHKRLVAAALKAIDAVHQDCSVPTHETLDSLKALRDHADVLCDAVSLDVQREQE